MHLAVFLFVMTAIVYETQHWTNPQIKNYVDALYFTVTVLTTTGFGDITLQGTMGRLISVLIMIFGVTLFCASSVPCCSPTRCASPAQPADCSVTISMRCTARPAARPSIYPTKVRPFSHAADLRRSQRERQRSPNA